MKTRGIELSIGRWNLSLLAALKFVLLAALVILFLKATISLYGNISSRYYTNTHPPFLRISYSSFSSSPPPCSHATASPMESESVSSFHLQSTANVSDTPSSSFASIPFSSSTSRFTPSPVPSMQNPPSPSSSSPAPISTPHPALPPIPLHIPSPIPYVFVPPPPPPKLKNHSSDNHSNYSSSPSPSPSSSSSSSYSPPPPLNPDGGGKRKGFPKGCDLSKGEWIRDPNAPYYTNSTCRTIQEHQNCMKYGRPDLDFLKWRWKPDGCELPLLEPADFLELMRGKKLAFIGDSLARNQMQSLMCLLSRVEYPQEIWPSSAENVTEMFYKNYNFTIWTFWSPFLVRATEKMTRDNYGVWSLYLDEPDPLWQPRLGMFDHIVLNTGNWYTRPAQFYERRKLIGCHYCVVKKVPFMSVYRAHRRAFRTALDAIVGNAQGFVGVTVVRSVSPSHFEGGEWNGGGDCRRTAPVGRSKAKVKGMDLELYRDQLKEFWKAKWEGGEKGLEFRLLDTTQAMVMRPDGHPSRYGHRHHDKLVLYNDCVHWCLPGPVDMWNDFLFQVLGIS